MPPAASLPTLAKSARTGHPQFRNGKEKAQNSGPPAMTTKELMDQYPDTFKKLGGIVYNLNRIEVSVITLLSVFFADRSDAQSEKNFIWNEALLDSHIFETFESKRLLLIKVIENMWRLAQEHSLPFDKEKWLGTCKAISGVQEVRNKLAHHMLSFLPDGNVGYHVKKRAKERVADRLAGKPGTMKVVEFDLDKELSRSQEVCDETDKLLREFLAETHAILAAVKR